MATPTTAPTEDEVHMDGGPTPAPAAATDPLAQLEQQFSYMADALYDLAKVAEGAANNGGPDSVALIQDAKTKINALNPEKFLFD